MWKPEHRRAAALVGLRYPNDLTDAEWALIAPLIPPAKRGGRRREIDVREVLNAIFYVLSTGCQWKALPKDLPPKSTAHFYFMLWDWGRHAGAHPPCALCGGAREGRPRGQPDRGHHRQPERQGGSKRGKSLDPQGFDAGKKVTGRKRHILVDTLGLLLSVAVHSAGIQDRDGAALVLDKRTRALFPFIERIYADGGYRGPRVRAAAARTGTWKIEIVKRSDIAKGLRCLAQTMGGRENLRLDQPQSTPLPRLRTLCKHRRGLHPSRHGPHHAPAPHKAKSLNMNPNFVDRL